MTLYDFSAEFKRLLRLVLEAARLPRAQLHFRLDGDTPDIGEVFANFTRPHPRFKLVRNKSVGMALVDLRQFASRNDYLSSVSHKDQGAYHGKRALRRGYLFLEIDRNDYIDDIHAINTSTAERQGRPMDASYLHKPVQYESKPHLRYYGVVDGDGRLVAYCNIATYGNFAATDRLLGYKNKDGIMYLLLVEIICRLIDDGEVRYFMYDTFLGAREGLRHFKRRLGFAPYRVRYSMSQP